MAKPLMSTGTGAARVLPGIALALAVTAAAFGIALVERRALGAALLEPLVVAILLGMLLRSTWTIPARFVPGIDFTAQQVLELAICLLGLSVNLPLILRAGPTLAISIPLLVLVGIVLGFGIGRFFGLPRRLAILVACGNAICGNSAIAAVAPIIRAEREHVASAIAFTAILGVFVVLTLPLLASPFGLTDYQYGVLAGLTVYAVPQVLAATIPVSTLAAQVGTLVKLVRVLMLGPVVLIFTLVMHHRTPPADRPRLALGRILPWFLVGFILLAALRSMGVVPDGAAAAGRQASGALTVIAMAALGLGVDLRQLRTVGASVIATVTCSVVALVAISLALIRLMGVG